VPADVVHSSDASEPAPPAGRLPAMQTLRRLAAAIALTILLATAAGCSVGSSPGLAARTFLSVAVTDGGVAWPLVAGTRIRLDFRASDLGASAGCNSIGGTYRLEGGRLAFEGGGMTEMACSEDRMAQDNWLVTLLGSKPGVRLSGDELTLESGTIVVRLLDRKVVEPDLALSGHAWTVVSIVAGDVVSSVPGGAVATVSFNTDGTLTLNAGCNQGGATWKAAGPDIVVSALVLTKKACQGAGGQLESAVVGVLGAGSIAAAIDGNLLTLQAAGGGLQLRAS
jgi:heat shock protein HslJ